MSAQPDVQASLLIAQQMQLATGGQGNALEVVMGIWIERQLEFMGAYRINLATTALVQMLASRHPALMSLQVWTQLVVCKQTVACVASDFPQHAIEPTPVQLD